MAGEAGFTKVEEILGKNLLDTLQYLSWSASKAEADDYEDEFKKQLAKSKKH